MVCIENRLLDYVVGQFKELERFLEIILKKKFDYKKFEEVLILSLKTSMLWKRILDLAKNKPSPINSFDTFIHMAPIVTLRGTKQALDYYEMFYNELLDLVAKKTGSIRNERYRLLWDNLPVWYKIKFLSEVFEKGDAALVVATYTNSWGVISENLDYENPYTELARAYISPYINRNFKDREDYLVNLIYEFDLNGFVMHSDRSCKPYSLGQYLIKNEVTKRTGKPGLIIETDMNDPRAFADEAIRTRIEAYLENL